MECIAGLVLMALPMSAFSGRFASIYMHMKVWSTCFGPIKLADSISQSRSERMEEAKRQKKSKSISRQASFQAHWVVLVTNCHFLVQTQRLLDHLSKGSGRLQV